MVKKVGQTAVDDSTATDRALTPSQWKVAATHEEWGFSGSVRR